MFNLIRLNGYDGSNGQSIRSTVCDALLGIFNHNTHCSRVENQHKMNDYIYIYIYIYNFYVVKTGNNIGVELFELL